MTPDQLDALMDEAERHVHATTRWIPHLSPEGNKQRIQQLVSDAQHAAIERAGVTVEERRAWRQKGQHQL